MRDPEELLALFGAHSLPFCAYNVVTSALLVLVSEPRGGVSIFVRGLMRDRPTIGMFVNVLSVRERALVVSDHDCYGLVRGWPGSHMDPG